MTSKTVRKARCEDLLKLFLSQSQFNVFLTLTTPDVVDIVEIRQRWRSLRHYLVELFGSDVKYVMNYEIHPKGHGWHIHSVWNRYIPLKEFLPKIQSFGFGRVDVRKAGSVGVADYLSKHCLKAYRGISRKDGGCSRLRLVNCSRGLPRLSDYVWESDLKKSVDCLFKQLSTFGVEHFQKLPFTVKYRICEMCVLLGISSPVYILAHYAEILSGGCFDYESLAG